MFSFIVKYLGVLKYIPLCSVVFDSIMFLYNIAFNRKIIDYIEGIEEEVQRWKGISVSMHKFGGVQFNYLNKEIGHIHGNGLLDILFNTKFKNNLIREGKAKEHHIFKKSGWVSFYIRSEEDKKQAVELLFYSYQMKRILDNHSDKEFLSHCQLL